MARRDWAREFRGQLTTRAALKLVKDAPHRYMLHVRTYGGVVEWAQLFPAAVLEDRSNGERFAIFPASHRIVRVCDDRNIEILDGAAKARTKAS